MSTEIRVSHAFAAAPELVYDAWLDREQVGRWMFGLTMQDEILHIEIDARVGGRFSFLVRRNGQEIDHVGEYLELDRPRRIVFTWGIAGMGNPSRVAIDIAASGAGAEATLTAMIPPEWADYADRTRIGWSKIVAALATTIS
ncbi:MAG: ATPase [Rhodospirillales bacterium]|nr:ATPase [Rhodospirillales bacterium]